MSLHQLKLYLADKGGRGSGDWGHSGRPGKVGGSGGGGGLASFGLSSTDAIELRRARSREWADARTTLRTGNFTLPDNSPQWLVDRIQRFSGMQAPAAMPAGPVPVTGNAKSSIAGADAVKSKLDMPYESVDKLMESIAWDNQNPTTVASRAAAVKLLQSYPQEGEGVLRYLNGLSTYTDSKTGMHFKDFTLTTYLDNHTGYTHARISASIHNKDSQYVGSITRTFNLVEKDVHHDWMSIAKSERDNGFGLRFYHESEKAYMAAGFKTVTLQANLRVGGYTWARLGFDADPNPRKDTVSAGWQQQPDKILKRVVKWYKDDYGTEPAKIPTTLVEAAVLTGPDGKRIGKMALLRQIDDDDEPNSDWYMGVKRLDPTDINYQVGLAYYRSKGVNVN